jgi:hypothetical protein
VIYKFISFLNVAYEYVLEVKNEKIETNQIILEDPIARDGGNHGTNPNGRLQWLPDCGTVTSR